MSLSVCLVARICVTWQESDVRFEGIALKHRISVMSRQEALVVAGALDDRAVIVSISDSDAALPAFPDNPFIESTLFLRFDDVDGGYGAMTAEHAFDILEFVGSYVDQPIAIIVHCGAGRSRSAGVAAALMLLLNGDDSPVFSNPLYSPNMHCYREVLNAALGTYDERGLSAREEELRSLWRRLDASGG